MCDIFTLYISANLFVLRTSFSPTHFHADVMKMGYKLATESFPNNALNNGVTLGNSLECAQLCQKYLYCTTFSYNDATNECRFVLGMNASSNATALTVYQQMCIALYLLFYTFQADSGFNTYEIVWSSFKSKWNAFIIFQISGFQLGTFYLFILQKYKCNSTWLQPKTIIVNVDTYFTDISTTLILHCSTSILLLSIFYISTNIFTSKQPYFTLNIPLFYKYRVFKLGISIFILQNYHCNSILL